MRMWRATFCVFLLAALVGCGNGEAPPPHLGSEFRALLETAVAAEPLVRGAAIHVDGPQILWEGAVGFADPENGIVMTADHPVRIASNTKTYVAAAILRLVEQEMLGLDDPISAHLPDEFVELLDAGGYDAGVMTIRHLLTHTSGLFDHGDETYAGQILDDPKHRWTRKEQLTGAIERGQPWGAPGEVYHYSDTGYVLLGEILERTTGEDFPGAMWQLIDRHRIGLGSTWFESLEKLPENTAERAHQFYGEVDTFAFDPSFDLWGGGGIVATVGDLAQFTRALFAGDVFDDSSTLQTMLTTIDGVGPASDATDHSLRPGAYRMGLWVVEVNGEIGYRHSGFWGTSATYFPNLDLVVTGTQNQNHGENILNPLVEKIVTLVRESRQAH